MSSYDELAANILADGVIDAEEVKKIREKIYADGIIDKEEADFLFKLNEGSSGAANDPSWKTLFVEAISDYILKDEKSPGVIDEEESRYLIEKIESDGVIDSNELALIVNLISNAKQCAPSFNAFVLEALRAAILEDGVIDDSEVEMIRKVIYGSASGGGTSVDKAEADFLFDLNDATSGKNNSPAWKTLFVEAISKHVLEDESSPGKIDEAEADWLIERIEGDGEYDENEKALLQYIKTHATDIHPKLKFKLDLMKI